jgi:tetratricopeptide (TPR) repeat protein
MRPKDGQFRGAINPFRADKIDSIYKTQTYIGYAAEQNQLGLKQLETQDFHGAVTSFRESLAVFGRLGLSSDPRSALPRINLGIALQETGDWVEAVEVLNEALLLSELHLGLFHPQVGTVLVNLANALSGRGDAEMALTSLLRAREVFLAAGVASMITNVDSLISAMSAP